MNTRPRHAKLSKAAVAAKPVRVQPPTPEETRERAHQIFLARGGTHGNDMNDWLLAEQELERERVAAHPQAPGSHPQQHA